MLKAKKIILSILSPIAATVGVAPVAISLASCGPSASISSIKITTTQTSLKINKSMKLEAEVSGSGSFDKSVIWTIESGSEYASINGDILTAGSTTGQTITVKATAKGDATKYKTLNITTTDKTPINFVMSNCTYTTSASELGTSDTVVVVITRSTGYDWPNTIYIEGCYAKQVKADPAITLTLTNPQDVDQITITCNCVEHQMVVKCVNGDNVSNTRVLSPSTPKKGQAITIGYDLANSEHTLWYGAYSTVTIGSAVYALDSDYITYDRDNHKITISADIVTGDDVIVKLAAGVKVYPTAVELNPTNLSYLFEPSNIQLIPTFTPVHTTERTINYEIHSFLTSATITSNGLIKFEKDFKNLDNLPIVVYNFYTEAGTLSEWQTTLQTKNIFNKDLLTPTILTPTLKINTLNSFITLSYQSEISKVNFYKINIDFTQIPDEYLESLNNVWAMNYNNVVPVLITLDDKELITNKDFTLTHITGTQSNDSQTIATTISPNSEHTIKFNKNSKLEILFYQSSTPSSSRTFSFSTTITK